MASFQAKIGWERPRKRQIKIFLPFPSHRTGNRKFQKKIRKFKKIKKIPLWLHFKRKQVGKGREIEKIKNVVPFRSHPTRNRTFQKNRKKFQKIKKPFMVSFQPKIGWKRLKKRENKNYRFVLFQHDA